MSERHYALLLPSSKHIPIYLQYYAADMLVNFICVRVLQGSAAICFDITQFHDCHLHCKYSCAGTPVVLYVYSPAP